MNRMNSYPSWSSRTRVVASALMASLTLGASGAFAQASGPGGWGRFASVTAIHQFDGDIDGGGSFGRTGAIVRVGAAGSVGAATFGGVTLNYDYLDYRFSDPVAFGGSAPWNTVQRLGFSVPINHVLASGWSLTLAPSFDWIGERGAKSGQSFSWGAVAAATKNYADGSQLGLGIGVFDRIEETTVFPYIVVDWPLTKRLKLTNPAVAGPTGPAGLELRYQAEGGWDLGVGGAWRSIRFRLSETGAVPNGVGEERGLPLFIRASRNFGGGASLSVYAGVIVAGSLRLEDASGGSIAREDFGTAPFVAATMSLRF